MYPRISRSSKVDIQLRILSRHINYYYDGAIHDFALILHVCTDRVCHQYLRLQDDNNVILVVCTILTTILIQYITIHYIFTVHYYINTGSTLQYIRVRTLLHYSLNRNATVMADTLVHYITVLFCLLPM